MRNLQKTKYTVLMFGLLIAATVVAQKKDGFVSIFDGKTLRGWEGDTAYWRVENGSIVGEITTDKLLKANTFIIWRGGEPGDFELKLEFKISKEGNSGINYRSVRLTEVPYALKGYQADIDGMNRYTGQNYEERGRTTLAYRGQTTRINEADKNSAVKNNAWEKAEVIRSMNRDSLQSFIRQEDWNEIHLVIKGNRLQHFVNGILMSDVTDNDNVNRKLKGLLGMQVHVGPPMKVEYRNIRLKQL
ncbi:MAG: DUF1080 domain-containing protein [Cyclobacteriaceae bacterium]|nr:DUF1080 domain-containing protein [Cyclobacteriaceae bacterium]